MTAFCLPGFGQSGSTAALTQVKTVYLLPMSHGMDQYLANRLTRGSVVQVATDPQQADSLITDHLGADFEASVKELYPEVKPAAVLAKSDDEQKDASEPPAGDDQKSSQLKSSGAERPPVPGRSRGMIFLVKRATGQVLWSTYHDPSIRRPKDLDRMAGKIAVALKKAMAPASPATPGDK